MLKDERGITLLILIITVIIMIILAGAGIRAGGGTIQDIRLQNFSFQLQQIQGQVDSMHEKMKNEDNGNYIEYNGKTMGTNIVNYTKAVSTLLSVRGINYNTANTEDKELYLDGKGVDTYYRYFSKRDLQNQLDIKNAKLNVIINFKTREVISVEPQLYEDTKYYRLQDLK